MTVGVIGCGLIGGSIGLACRGNGHRVLAHEPDPASAKIGSERGCADEFLPLLDVAQAEITFVCVPPLIIESVLEQVLNVKPMNTVATDCTSVKGSVVKWLEERKDTMFVPGHPMAGHEKSGPQYSSAWMFRGAKWIITPCKFTDSGAVQSVEKLVKEMGAMPVRLKAERHDRDVALLSHLPHALAAVLVKMAGELDSTDASAGSWRDLTRVGGVDPNLWTQIMISNRIEVARALHEFGNSLGVLQSALEAGDEASVRVFFEEAKREKEKHK
jgi:prephenate dehydrogenase